MLRWLRRSPGLVTPIAAITGALIVLGTVNWWHPADDDAIAPIHDHSAHHPLLGTARTVQAPQHCDVCHWLRALRNSLEARPAVRHSERAVAHLRPARAVQPADRVAVLLSARAPPV